MSDRIAVMRNGVFEQVAAKTEIYPNPATAFVASFVGQSNRIEGSAAGDCRRRLRAVRLEGHGPCGAERRATAQPGDRVAFLHQVRGRGDRARRSAGSDRPASTRSPARCATSSSKARRRTTSCCSRTVPRSSSAARRATSILQPGEAVTVHWPASRRRQLPGLARWRPIAAIRLTHRPQWRFAFLAGPGVAVHLSEPAAAAARRSSSSASGARRATSSTPTGTSTTTARCWARPPTGRSSCCSLDRRRGWCLARLPRSIAWPVAYFIAKYGGRYRLLLVLLLAAPFFTGDHPAGHRRCRRCSGRSA